MKITNIKWEKLRVELDKPFVIAIGVATHAETMIVKVETDEGITGYGEATPSAAVTGETIDTAAAVLPLLRDALAGQNPFSMESIHKIMASVVLRNSSAKAGIDIALYDIMGKRLGMPLYKLLGGHDNKLITDMTVSIDTPEAMAAEALAYKQQGFGVLKIKAGIDPEADMLAMGLIREAVGPKMRLRADANQGWSVNTAIKVMDVYGQYGVEMVEQPVKHWDIDGLAYIRRRTKVALGADESLHTPEDAVKLAKARAVDVFNIKLMKSGGIYPAQRINAIGEAAGIGVMLGCMMETRIGNAASAALVAAQKNITEADLDSFVHFEGAMGISGGFDLKNGVMTLSEKPGLGIEIDF
ncbi:MAG: dipeptide epimerase [Clostridiales bacterium]|jgi:L-alanine-DL-glutamate epimerase-like enolase superfamily enzyme|nr:dipeptide epimerase [Clostridiales bacterium]